MSRTVGDEILVMLPEQRKLHVLNDTAGFIWGCLAEPRTEDELAEAITSEYNCDRATADRDIAEYLRRLKEQDLVSGQPEK